MGTKMRQKYVPEKIAKLVQEFMQYFVSNRVMGKII